jgi:murein DD-endopeptidase MepM/ murein hydrolase activator NlpD
MATMSNWQWPVQGKTVPASEGVIIHAAEGAPIRAAGDGTVAYVGNQPNDFGNLVIIRHADGAMTSYAHAREILVSKGDGIRQGDLLGYVGKTGNAPVAQLHFGMRVADAPVNPLHYLPQSLASR